MRKILKRIKSTNFLYFIVGFSVTISLSISALGGYLYRFSYVTIYKDFVTSNEEHLSTILSRHENDLQVLEDVVMQVGLSDTVTGFILSEKPGKAKDLINQLYQYTSVSQYFEMVLYLYHEDTYLYNQTTSISVSNFVSRDCVLQGISAENFVEELYSEVRGLRVFPEQEISGAWCKKYISGNDQVVIYMQAIAPGYDETMVFLVPESYYDALLEEEAESMRSDFIIYDGEIIVQRGLAEVDSEELLSILASGETSGRIKTETGTYLLTVDQGDSGLIYCSVQSMEVFRDKFMFGQWGLIFFLLICIGPAILLILFFSRYLTSKVHGINQMLNPEDGGYDINNIENGIQQLVAANARTEKESRQLRKSMFVQNFVRGDFENEEVVRREALDAGIEIGNGVFLALLMGKRNGDNEEKVHRKMLDVISQSPNLDGYGISLVSNNQTMFVLFGDSRERIESALGSLFTLGKEYFEDFVMAVSDYHRDLTAGADAFLEADGAYDNRFLCDNNQIIRYGEVSLKEEESVISEADLQKLRHALHQGDKGVVKECVEEICQKMSRANPSLHAFRVTYNSIIHVLLTEWKGRQSKAGDIYNVFALSQCLTIKDLNDLLYDTCETIMENNPQEEKQQPDLVQEAKAYMEENFANPNLTMAMLSEHLNLSPVTLAIVFKNTTGIRPSDYLGNQRMERAREMLTETNMQIQEISMAVGYEDPHVFIRRFKKYTGMTPGQYREKNR